METIFDRECGYDEMVVDADSTTVNVNVNGEAFEITRTEALALADAIRAHFQGEGN